MPKKVVLEEGDAVRVSLGDRWYTLYYSADYRVFVDKYGRTCARPDSCVWVKCKTSAKKEKGTK